MSNSLKSICRRCVHYISASGLFVGPLRSLSTGGMLPPALWRRFGRPPGRFSIPLPAANTSFQYRAVLNDGIGFEMFWGGVERCWEAETMSIFCTLACASSTIVDVGANTGIYTLLACALNPLCRAIALEPVPEIYAILQENVAMNGFLGRCTCINMAAADYTGKASFHVPYEDCPTSGSLNPLGHRNSPGRLLEVDVTTLDHVRQVSGPINLVKIDVEGFEDCVLRGMLTVLMKDHPTLIVECTPDGPIQNMENILRAYDYTFYHLQKSGPVLAPAIKPDVKEKYRNYLCVSRSANSLPQGFWSRCA
jgi:FkbM family methyltransferase